MNNRGWLALLALGVLALLALDSFYIVNQTEKAADPAPGTEPGG